MRVVAMTWAFLVDSVEFTRDTVAGKTSLGGSESACLGLARALAARGHDVHVYATKLQDDAQGPDHAGVTWHHADQFAAANAFLEWDVVVALRMFHWFGSRIKARLRLLWNQDLLMPGVGPQVMSIAWQLDHMVYVSEYHRRQWEDSQPEFAPLGWVTKNGYDVSAVPDDVTKDPTRIIHISRPERGLAPLLAMWPDVKKQRPNATLQICRYSSMYDAQGWGRICASFDDEVARVNAQVGGITYLGELAKPALYRAIAEAAVMWYPGVETFAETSCIAAIEAQACGTPFVGSWKGALPETVPSGVLLHGDAMGDAYQRASVAEVVAMLDGCASQSFSYRRRVKDGLQHVQSYAYEAIAEAWESRIDRWFAERYEAHKPAVLRQLLHEDDHVAAKVVADALGDTAASDFCERVIAGLEQGAEDYAAHAITDPLLELTHSDRFHAVIPKFAQCTSVLDVACGNGAFAIGLAQAYPAIRVHGLDYAQGNIDTATAAAQRAGVADRVRFDRLTVWDFTMQQMHAEWSGIEACAYDGAFIGEFAEHVANVTTLVDDIEGALTTGATVVYTCPSGPFVELMPHDQPVQRGHVHHFAHDDIKAIWGRKANCQCDYMAIGVTTRGNPIGHWIISYTTDGTSKAGQRDLRARTRRTRPQQKVTVGLITRNAANDIRRCLESVWPIADEIIIGDTGSTDRTLEIATEFRPKTVLHLPAIAEMPGGFAEARNAVLAAAAGDWFLWIDADEILVGGHHLHGYLDGRLYNGFVIHQKHVYQDGPPTFDIPVRCFRKRDDIQFYGCVHEQPQQGDCNGDIHPTLEPLDLEILHTGYLTESVREHKRVARNLPLIIEDQKINPSRQLGKVILIREIVLQSDAKRAEAAGMVGSAHMVDALQRAAQRGYEHAVSLFVAHFDDPSHKLHGIARPWYETALRGLGVGFEMELGLAGKRGGLNGARAKGERIWVRDAAEFGRLAAHQVEKIQQQMEPSWTVKTNPDLSVTGAEPALSR